MKNVLNFFVLTMAVIKSLLKRIITLKLVYIIQEYINSVLIMAFGPNVGHAVKENGKRPDVPKDHTKKFFCKID